MKKLYFAFFHAYRLFYKFIEFLTLQFRGNTYSLVRFQDLKVFSIALFCLSMLPFAQVANGQSVVVNKYRNTGGATDIIELLVVQDQADLRGLVLKDFSSSNANDGGSSRTFTTNSLWNGLRAGTLIVITIGSTGAADVSVSCTDFNLNVGGNNTTYFTVGGGTFDLGNNDMCMIKSGTTTGVANNIHTLRAGSAAAQWTAIASGTRIGTTSTTDGAGTTADIVFVANASSVIGDFNLGTTGASIGGSGTISFGSGNNSTNTNFITFLRGPVSTAGTTIGSAGFTANWGSLTGASSYRLDVSTASDFSSFVSGYNDLNVGNVTNYSVTGLNPNTTYYYRIRGVNVTPTTSGNSCSQTVQTTAGTPTLSINDVSLSEGNAGTTNFVFTVSLSSPAPAGGVTFDIATSDGTASSASDFADQALTNQTIPQGSSTYTFTVVVNGDLSIESNETFTVLVDNITGANIADSEGLGTIVNDDTCPTPTITVTENFGNLPENNGNICIGDQATLTASGGGTYVWSTTETTSSITVAPNITTTYTVTVTNGSCVGTAMVVITVDPKPQVFDVTGGGSYCGVGSGIAIGVNGSEATARYFLYRNNLYVTDIPGTGNALSFGSFTQLGTYQIVAAYSSTGCFIGMTGSAVINTGGVSFTATPTNGACPESNPSVTLDVPAASGYKYDISTGATYTGTMTVFAGGTTINADPVDVYTFPSAPAIAGTQYTVRVIDLATGCYSDKTFTVSGIPVPCDCEAPPFVNFTPLNSTSCDGATVTIGYTVENGPATINTTGFLGAFSETTLNDGTGTFTYTPAPAEVGTTLTIFANIADPDGGDPCTGDTASANITVNPLTEPMFSPAGTFCEGVVPTTLPASSNNGIAGTWDPSSISTSTPGTYTFIFTPNSGQCADTASMKVVVTPKAEPAFSEITNSYCQGETPESLPAESDNGVAGTWSPATVNTSTPGTTTYIFTPASGECADTASVKITISPKVEPTFSILSTYCQGETPVSLPTTSNNGISGNWSPSTISTATPGTTKYSFFINENEECADSASIKVVVSTPVIVEAGTPQTICGNQTFDLSDIGASISGGTTSGTWSTSGTGSFTGGTVFGSASAYVPSVADKAAGTITLTLTSADPAGPCPAVVDTVVITIRNFNCSTFPWNGGK